jgi:MFS family permease
VIAGDLGRITDVSWVVTAYVVAAAAATPLWGKLGDRLGRKRMLELALRDQRGGVTAASLLRSES